MKKGSLTPTKLRLILTCLLFVTLILAGVVFKLAQTRLQTTATDVSHKVADANASRNNLENLKKIQKFLDDNKDTISRVNNIVAESKSYQYQDQIILDLNAYAAKAGISITNFGFTDAAAATAAATPAAPATTSATPGTTAATPTVGGDVKSTSVSITVANPVKYESLLRFVKSIEQNLTKMQISKVSLSKGTETDEVTTDALTIEIYVR